MSSVFKASDLLVCAFRDRVKECIIASLHHGACWLDRYLNHLPVSNHCITLVVQQSAAVPRICGPSKVPYGVITVRSLNIPVVHTNRPKLVTMHHVSMVLDSPDLGLASSKGKKEDNRLHHKGNYYTVWRPSPQSADLVLESSRSQC